MQLHAQMCSDERRRREEADELPQRSIAAKPAQQPTVPNGSMDVEVEPRLDVDTALYNFIAIKTHQSSTAVQKKLQHVLYDRRNTDAHWYSKNVASQWDSLQRSHPELWTTGEWVCTLCGHSQDHTICQGCGKETRPTLDNALPPLSPTMHQPSPPQLPQEAVETPTDKHQEISCTTAPPEDRQVVDKRARTESNEQQMDALKDKQDKAREEDTGPGKGADDSLDDIIGHYQTQADAKATRDPINPHEDEEVRG